jgi:hypothetical protein
MKSSAGIFGLFLSSLMFLSAEGISSIVRLEEEILMFSEFGYLRGVTIEFLNLKLLSL